MRARSGVILLPAVDIRDGRAVRLEQGDFGRETVYGDDPLEAARSFVEAGARFLHVIDLDGARRGQPASLRHLERIAGELGVPVQYGGGLRSPQSVTAAFRAGARRVVLGTAAYADPNVVEHALMERQDGVAVALDVRGGRVAVFGWLEQTDLAPEEVVSAWEARGVQHFVYTDVERDGMLEGPDLDGLGRVAEATAAGIVYSGGVGSVDHLRALRALGLGNLEGVVSGKALYERRFTIREAEEVLR
jgi:phosphoribosylformimino-5-aminoimidazole carboxamide ribotide isomerase